MTETKPYVCLDLETSGLLPWSGDRITAICAKDSLGNIFQEAGDNELDIVKNFLEWMVPRKDYLLITFNGLSFDLPFLFTRALLIGFMFVKFIFIKDMEHFDLFTVPNRFVSLENFSRILGFEEGKTGNGFEAVNMYKNKEFDKLKEYCLNDVNLTEKCYLQHVSLKNTHKSENLANLPIKNAGNDNPAGEMKVDKSIEGLNNG